MDDLLCSLKDPKAFIDTLESPPYNYQLKGNHTKEPDVLLGGSFSRDEDGTLLWNAEKYVERLAETFRVCFNEAPRKRREPMHPEVRPELNESNLCNDEEKTTFQRILGAIQWTITLCRFDICGTVLSLNVLMCPSNRSSKMDSPSGRIRAMHTQVQHSFPNNDP